MTTKMKTKTTFEALFAWNERYYYRFFLQQMAHFEQALQTIQEPQKRAHWQQSLEQLNMQTSEIFQPAIIAEPMLATEALDALRMLNKKKKKKWKKIILPLTNKIHQGQRINQVHLQRLQAKFPEPDFLQTQQRQASVLIALVDAFDLVSASAKEQSELENLRQIAATATAKLLRQLKTMKITEIEVLGKLLDGNTMISIGTVPSGAIPTYDEKYVVCYVQQRGYKYFMTDTLIREAQVLNVY